VGHSICPSSRFGPPHCSSYRSVMPSTRPSLELSGLPPYSSCRSGIGSISPSLELCGQPPWRSYSSGIGSTGVEWPITLQLLFGSCFNQSTVGVMWPAFLQQLSVGHHAAPCSVMQRHGGFGLNQPIA